MYGEELLREAIAKGLGKEIVSKWPAGSYGRRKFRNTPRSKGIGVYLRLSETNKGTCGGASRRSLSRKRERWQRIYRAKKRMQKAIAKRRNPVKEMLEGNTTIKVIR